MPKISDFKDGKWKKQIGKKISSFSGFIFQNKEQSKIDSLEEDKAVHMKDIESAYTSIGRKVYKNIIDHTETDSDIDDIVNKIKSKYELVLTIDKEIVGLKKQIANQTILQEKEELEKAYEKEVLKLKEALEMDLISEEDYNRKIIERKLYLDKFDDIRKIKKQHEMNIITKEEMEQKIEDIIS